MKDINEILAKHFSGEITPEESVLLETWKAENEEEFKSLSAAWKTADKALFEGIEFKQFDHKAAWKKVDGQLNDETTVYQIPESETKVIKHNFYRKVAAACAILLVGLAGFWFIKGNDFKSISNTANVPKEITLPDGSQVWLAANTTLEYHKDFKNQRSLNLTGEAFFEVARDEAHPFIISTAFGKVEVLGTGFNVLTSETETVVSVSHGKVALGNEKGRVELTAGQSANANAEVVSAAEAAPKNFDSWQSGKFEFEKTPLAEVIDLLNKHYEKKITLEVPEKANEEIKGTFNNQPIEEIINVIVLTCHLEADFSDDMIRLK